MAAMGVALPIQAARADDTPVQSRKFTKKVAGYVEVGHGQPEICGMCHYFLDPDQCVIVEGPVNPRHGWCNYGATTG
jgi:hypothetical protein